MNNEERTQLQKGLDRQSEEISSLRRELGEMASKAKTNVETISADADTQKRYVFLPFFYFFLFFLKYPSFFYVFFSFLIKKIYIYPYKLYCYYYYFLKLVLYCFWKRKRQILKNCWKKNGEKRIVSSKNSFLCKIGTEK